MPGSPSGTWLSSLLHLRWCIGRGHRWSRLISSSAHRGGVWSRLAQMAPYPKLGNGQNGESNVISFKLIDLRRVFDKFSKLFHCQTQTSSSSLFWFVYCLLFRNQHGDSDSFEISKEDFRNLQQLQSLFMVSLFSTVVSCQIFISAKTLKNIKKNFFKSFTVTLN